MPGISEHEVKFITSGVEADIRSDARKRTDFREVVLETGLVLQSSGSARCLIDNTDVLVGVKIEIGDICPEYSSQELGDSAEASEQLDEDNVDSAKTDRGRVVCNVDWCVFLPFNLSPTPSTPSTSSKFLDSRRIQDLCIEYSQYMNLLLNGPNCGIDLEALCIIPGSTCWIVYVDALILNDNGNLLDAIMMATRAALGNCRMGKSIVEEAEGKADFDIEDEETEPLEGWRDVPLSVTACKIGSRFVLDATPMEELASDVKLMVAVNRQGRLCSVQKHGDGSLEPMLLTEMVRSAQKACRALLADVDKVLAIEEARLEGGEDAAGFL